MGAEFFERWGGEKGSLVVMNGRGGVCEFGMGADHCVPNAAEEMVGNSSRRVGRRESREVS